MSAADPKTRCVDIIEQNVGAKKPTHWYHNLKDQISNKACALHPYAHSCLACPVSADLGICGTPCHPYSTARPGRYQEGSVQKHAEFRVAMDEFMSWLQQYEPAVQIFEQVLGFNMPFVAGGTRTPLAELLACTDIAM